MPYRSAMPGDLHVELATTDVRPLFREAAIRGRESAGGGHQGAQKSTTVVRSAARAARRSIRGEGHDFRRQWFLPNGHSASRRRRRRIENDGHGLKVMPRSRSSAQQEPEEG